MEDVGRTAVNQFESIEYSKSTVYQFTHTETIMSKQELKLTFDDVMGCQTAVYEWADSYDSKVHHFLILLSITLTTDRIGTAYANASPLH